jgi:hypothetical protein
VSTEPKWAIVAIEGGKRWYFDSAETHAEAREKQVKWNHRAATDHGWSEMAFVLEKYWEPEMTDDMADGSRVVGYVPKPEMGAREILLRDCVHPTVSRVRLVGQERCDACGACREHNGINNDWSEWRLAEPEKGTPENPYTHEEWNDRGQKPFLTSQELDRAECAALRKDRDEDRAEVPAEVHERGWRWRPTDEDTAFAPPFGTIRACRSCGCLVSGGPTACGRCVDSWESAQKPVTEVRSERREAAQILIEEIGAQGPENVEATARRAVEEIRSLRIVLNEGGLLRGGMEPHQVRRADAQANLDIEKKAHEITRGMLEACAKRLVKLSETIRQREQEHLEACAEADELRADLAESNALLTRVEKYAREDRAVTPGCTRLARVLDEIRAVLDEPPLDEPLDVKLTEKGRAAVLSDLGMTLSPEQVAQAKVELAASLDAIKRQDVIPGAEFAAKLDMLESDLRSLVQEGVNATLHSQNARAVRITQRAKKGG